MRFCGTVARWRRGSEDARRHQPESDRLAAAETFTAGSLEAMRAYARAQELTLANQFEEALAAYRGAVAVDPRFRPRLHRDGSDLQQLLKISAKGEEHYQTGAEAPRSDDGAREVPHARRLLPRLVARNYEKAIENYETLVELYPGRRQRPRQPGARATCNVGNVPGRSRKCRKASRSIRRTRCSGTTTRCTRCTPAISTPRSARHRRAHEGKPGVRVRLSAVRRFELAQGDAAGARKATRSSQTLSPLGASFAQLGEADLEMYLGRYSDARVASWIRASPRDMRTRTDAGWRRSYVAARRSAPGARPAPAARRSRPARSSLNRARKHARFLPRGSLSPLASLMKRSRIATDLENMLQRQTVAYARIDIRRDRSFARTPCRCD